MTNLDPNHALQDGVPASGLALHSPMLVDPLARLQLAVAHFDDTGCLGKEILEAARELIVAGDVAADIDRWRRRCERLEDQYDAYRKQVVRDLNAEFKRGKQAALERGPMEWRVVGWDDGDREPDDLIVDDDAPPTNFTEAVLELRRAQEEVRADPYDHYAIERRRAVGPWERVDYGAEHSALTPTEGTP